MISWSSLVPLVSIHVTDWPTPSYTKEVQQFLGFLLYITSSRTSVLLLPLCLLSQVARSQILFGTPRLMQPSKISNIDSCQHPSYPFLIQTVLLWWRLILQMWGWGLFSLRGVKITSLIPVTSCLIVRHQLRETIMWERECY